MPTPLPVCIVVRVFTNRQETDRQTVELTDYANAKGYKIIEVCREAISGAAEDEWISSLAPSETLLHQIQTGEISWAAFRAGIQKRNAQGWCDGSARNSRMRNSGQSYFIRILRKIAENQTVTVLCTCPPDAHPCPRFLLQNLLQS